MGTADAVPALAALLAEEATAQAARDALESMSDAAAGEALRAALGGTSSAVRQGIIDSLGLRRERAAVPDLARLLADPDPDTAAAAACSLGRIATSECGAALRARLADAPPALRPAIVDGLLRCAGTALAEERFREAEEICRVLTAPSEAEHVRVAAFRALLLGAGAVDVRGLPAASAGRASAFVTNAIVGTDPAARMAALHVAPLIQGQEVNDALAAMIGGTDAPEARLALIHLLAQRRDRGAPWTAVSQSLSHPDLRVRLAAIEALGDMGDASTAALLLDCAVKNRGAEREAARSALARLRRGDVASGLLARMPTETPAGQEEIVRALALRREATAAPALLRMADSPSADLRLAAIGGVGAVGDETSVTPLVALMARGSDGETGAALTDALAAIAGRCQCSGRVADELLALLPAASLPSRSTLLRAAGRMDGARALPALRSGLKDPEASIRTTALRTLAEHGPTEALPDLLATAKAATDATERTLALRGYWRLVAAADRPARERLAWCRDGMAAAQSPEERRLGLAELGRVPSPEALAWAEQAGRDGSVRSEADLACLQIAGRLLAAGNTGAGETLRRLAGTVADERLRAEAAALVQSMEQHSDFLAAWWVSGPYRQEGQQCQQLYDVAFPPEGSDAQAAEWRPLPPPADAALFWQADLGGVVGGDHAVAYLRTRVHADAAQPVNLEIGSDDGIKLWVNGHLVHANNAVRALAPGQDRAQAQLRAGWNDVLAKITQHTMGCAATIRVRAADGSAVAGLRCEPIDPL